MQKSHGIFSRSRLFANLNNSLINERPTHSLFQRRKRDCRRGALLLIRLVDDAHDVSSLVLLRRPLNRLRLHDRPQSLRRHHHSRVHLHDLLVPQRRPHDCDERATRIDLSHLSQLQSRARVDGAHLQRVHERVLRQGRFSKHCIFQKRNGAMTSPNASCLCAPAFSRVSLMPLILYLVRGTETPR